MTERDFAVVSNKGQRTAVVGRIRIPSANTISILVYGRYQHNNNDDGDDDNDDDDDNLREPTTTNKIGNVAAFGRRQRVCSAAVTQ